MWSEDEPGSVYRVFAFAKHIIALRGIKYDRLIDIMFRNFLS